MLTIAAALTTAAHAAQAIRVRCVDARAASTMTVEDVRLFTNSLQDQFERIGPLLAFQSAEIQATSAELFGSRAPADVLATIAAAQAAGQALVAAILGGVYDPATDAAHAWHEPSGRILDRALAGSDLTPMHAALDALIAELAAFA